MGQDNHTCREQADTSGYLGHNFFHSGPLQMDLGRFCRQFSLYLSPPKPAFYVVFRLNCCDWDSNVPLFSFGIKIGRQSYPSGRQSYPLADDKLLSGPEIRTYQLPCRTRQPFNLSIGIFVLIPPFYPPRIHIVTFIYNSTYMVLLLPENNQLF